MRLKRYITEAFLTGYKSKLTNSYIEIFKNPGQREMKDVSNIRNGKRYLRFIADNKTKTLYIHSENEMHNDIWSEIKGDDKRPIYTDSILPGIAIFWDGHWEIQSTSTHITPKFKWLKRWFKNIMMGGIPQNIL